MLRLWTARSCVSLGAYAQVNASKIAPHSKAVSVLVRTASTTASVAKDAFRGLEVLRQNLDEHIVGHGDTKTAMILALISREHVYVEGAPGVAKTMLAELVTESASLEHFFYQMHRDTRVNELVGEMVIKRSVGDDGTETIAQGITPGGILSAELAVLDDLSRAPGESLNVLLRVLNERKWGNESIPLLSAIATGNPVSEDGYYGDPLDGATLDRFALQIKAHGLVETSSWDDAGRVIDFYAAPQAIDEERYVSKVHPNLINDAASLVPLVVFGQDAKRVLLRLLEVLCEDYGCDDTNSLLTDRTFLVKAVKIMKANAIVERGDQEVLPEDLRVLRFLTTFRVPEQVHDQIDEIIAGVLAEAHENPPPPPPGTNPDSEGHPEGGLGDDSAGNGDDSGDNDAGDDGSTPSGQGSADGSQNEDDDDLNENGGNAHGNSDDENGSSASNSESHGNDQTNSKDGTNAEGSGSESSRSDTQSGGNSSSNGRDDGSDKSNQGDTSEFQDSTEHGDEIALKAGSNKDDSREMAALRTKVKNLEPLLDQLKGALERGQTDLEEHPGGLPRNWMRPRSMYQGFEDVDQAELALWARDPSPQLPRIAKRTRPGAGGRVCVIRDTSMSMQGMWNDWAGLLCSSVMDLASKRRMRMGYLEFNSRVNKYVDDRLGHFFTSEYNLLRDRISSARCDGLTNYELPLSMALAEFDKSLPRHRRIRPGQIDRAMSAMQSSASSAPPGVNLAYGSTISGVKLIESMAKQKTEQNLSSSAALRKSPKDQHILFVTDGQPTSGDRSVAREIAQAQTLGVAIHTVFIGYNNCPAVLDRLSVQTGGSRFAAYFDVDTKAIQVIDRDAVSLQALYADSGRDHELRMLDRMTRMPTVFQRFLDENNLVV